MIPLVADLISTFTDVAETAVDSAPAVQNNLFTVVHSLFPQIPESYYIILYFVCAFIVCLSFKFLIDFLKIVFSLIFRKGGYY